MTLIFLLLVKSTCSCQGQGASGDTAANKKDWFKYTGIVDAGGGYLQNNQYGQQGFYSHISLRPKVIFFGVPVQSGFDLYSSGRAQFGRFSIDFSKSGLQDYLSGRLTEKELGLIKKDQYSLVKDRLKDQSYLEQVSEAEVRYRRMLADSVAGGGFTEQLERDSLRQIVEEYQDLRADFYSLRNKAEENADSLKHDSLPGLITDRGADTLPKLKMNKTQEFFSRFESISIGHNILNQSLISIYHYSYSGVSLDYYHRNLIVGTTAGKHVRSYSTYFLPFSQFQTFQTSEPVVMQGRLGYGNKENHLIASLSQFESSTSLYPGYMKNVRLINFKSRKRINSISVGEAEYSSMLRHGSYDNSNAQDYAYRVALENNFESAGAELNMEFSVVGRDFFTAGNEFLVRDFQTLSGSVSKTFNKPQFEIGGTGLRSWSSTIDRLSGKIYTQVPLSNRLEANYSVMMHRLQPKILENTQIQFLLSHQLILSADLSESLKIKTTGYYGTVEKNNLTFSTDVLLSVFLSLKLAANQNISFQMSHRQRHQSTYTSQYHNGTITYQFVVMGKITCGLSCAGYLSASSFSFDGTAKISYPITSRMTVQLSSNVRNYFLTSSWENYQNSSHTQGYLQFRF